MVKVEIRVSRGLQGMRFFWAKHVTGFDPSCHCMNCLLGERLSAVKLPLAEGGKASLELPSGALVYLCGVATPYVWRNNFHLPFKVGEDASARSRFWTGQTCEVIGGKQIVFNSKKARELYPEKGRDFLTCRNFQFGAQMFPDPTVRIKRPRKKRAKTKEPA